MFNRRDFLKSASTAGGLWLINTSCSTVTQNHPPARYFGVHPFVENHPEAVFIIRTKVDRKTNTQALKEAALQFIHTVLVPKAEGKGSIPLTHKIAIKPNFTCSSANNKKFPLEYGLGINTDPNFLEGIIEGMKELGLSGNQFYLKEVNCPQDFESRGFYTIAERTGAELKDQNAEIGKISSDEINWVDVPDGWIHKKIPYLWPINTRDCWLLNIAKFKSHSMGVTLCCKNHQGSVARHYQQFCGNIGALAKVDQKHLVENYREKCKTNYERHVAQGIPRWDKPGESDNAMRMDIWATRTLDNLSASPTGLFVVEGIYGRDGDAFLDGPNKGLINDHEARDYMTNIIIFGKDPFRVDIVGHWLGGHEPGNFGLFHLALERGMSTVLNPMDIPVYLWKDGKAALTPLTDFERTPLKCDYLQRNYNGQNEPLYHLVNEPFDYSSVHIQRSEHPARPKMNVLSSLRPYSVANGLSIEYALPQDGYARMEIVDSSFRKYEVLVDGYQRKGFHMAVLNSLCRAPGTYYCRYRYKDFDTVQKIVLM